MVWWFSQKKQKQCENNNASGTQFFNFLVFGWKLIFYSDFKIVNFININENPFFHPDSAYLLTTLFTSIASRVYFRN